MEQLNTGNWPFDGSITADVQIEDLTPEVLEYANERKISLNGTERISGVMHYMWQAAENADFDAIDEFIAYVTVNKIPSCVLHEKRPRSHYQTQPEPLWMPCAGTERGVIADSEITWPGRGMTHSATTEMLMQLEDDQIAFGLEALNKYLGEGIRPGMLTGKSDIVATAFPSDIEERRAAFAAEQSALSVDASPAETQEWLRQFDGPDQRVIDAVAREDHAFHQSQVAKMQTGVEIKTVQGLHETKSGAEVLSWDKFQVICDETNNPPEVLETGDLNVDILLDMNHISAKLSDMGISWQGGSSQNINTEYAIGYAKHIMQLRDDHAVEPEPITLIDGKLVAGETKKQNHARVIDLFKHAAKVGIGKRVAIDYADNPKGSQIITAYDVSLREDNAVQTVTRKDLDGQMYVLSTHSICAYDVARITDKQNRQMLHMETAEFLTEMRKESGSHATVSPAYVAAMNAQDARKKQKKVKTKTRNKRTKR